MYMVTEEVKKINLKNLCNPPLRERPSVTSESGKENGERGEQRRELCIPPRLLCTEGKDYTSRLCRCVNNSQRKIKKLMWLNVVSKYEFILDLNFTELIDTKWEKYCNEIEWRSTHLIADDVTSRSVFRLVTLYLQFLSKFNAPQTSATFKITFPTWAISMPVCLN
jgi:hypothetical protein